MFLSSILVNVGLVMSILCGAVILWDPQAQRGSEFRVFSGLVAVGISLLCIGLLLRKLFS